MNTSRFFGFIVFLAMSFTITQIAIAQEIKNTSSTTNNPPTETKPLANAWNWGGYLKTVQKSIPLGTPNQRVMDKVMVMIQNNQSTQAKEYLMEEYNTNGDYDGLVSFLIGFFNVEGIGSAKNPVEGFNFMKKSASRGFADAEYQLARYYANGVGTPVDTLQAVIWYKAASQAGNQDATVNLKYLFINSVVPDNWLTPCKGMTEAGINDKLVNARNFYTGYKDRDGNKVNPDIQKALNELNDVVPSCVNPPQAQS